MGISIDDSRWPVVVMRIVGAMTGPDIVHHFRVTTPALCARGRFASVIDGRNAELPRFDAATRHKLSEGLKEARPILLEKLISEAYVIESAVARGIITAVWWVVPPAWPAVVLGSLVEGVAWSNAQVHEASTTGP